MNTVEEKLAHMAPIGVIDKQEISKGFDAGNYASSYQTENYDEVLNTIGGQTGFWRVGFLLGFFSSYELQEIPARHRVWVAHYRSVVRVIPDLRIAVD